MNLSVAFLSSSARFKTSSSESVSSTIHTGIMWYLDNKSTCDLVIGQPSRMNLNDIYNIHNYI